MCEAADALGGRAVAWWRLVTLWDHVKLKDL